MVNPLQKPEILRRIRYWLTVPLVLVLLGVAVDQDALGMTCQVKVDPPSARRGDVVVLTVTASGGFGWSADFELPDVVGASIGGGGTNQSVSMVNGRTQSSVSHTYYLTITSNDDVTIGPVKVNAGKEECSTDPVTIKVNSTGSGTSTNTGASQPSDSHTKKTVAGPTGVASGGQGGKPGDDVFITLEVDKPEVYVGQQIVLTFSYWWRVQPWNNPTYTPPKSEGFWREDLGKERNFNRVVAGRNYSVTQVRYALFPTRSGDLTIEPAELRFPGDVFNRFFSSRARSRGPRILRTDPVAVKVLKLPSPKPAGFSGVVAEKLDLRAEVDQDSVQVGDPISLKVNLIADGFLKGFQGLTFTPPVGARLHDATESFETNIYNDHLVGHVAVEKIIVPQTGGLLNIPPLKLAWFDTASRSYKVAEADVAPVLVTGSDLAAGAGDASGFLRTGLTRVGDDLAFIHPTPTQLKSFKRPVVKGVLWWVLMLLPLLLLGLWKVYLDRAAYAGLNPAHGLRKRAYGQAKSLLQEAQNVDDLTTSCTSIARALRTYVANCQGLANQELEPNEIHAFAVATGGVPLGDRLLDVLSKCDAVRFGGLRGQEVASLVSEAELIIKAMEDGRNQARSSQATLSMLMISCLLLGAVAFAPRNVDAQAVPGSDSLHLLTAGNQAYTAGDLAKAEKLYLQVQDQGVADATLQFNLGNTYAREGKKGRAIACYLRARRLSPRDPDIRENLAWVRSNIRDIKLDQDTLPLFVAQLSAVVSFLTLDEWSIAGLILWWFFCLLVAWGFARGYWDRQMRRSLTALGAVIIFTAGAVGWHWYHDVHLVHGVVVTETVEVRSGPATSFPVLFEVHDGLTVNIVSSQDGWVRISLGGDWAGWLPVTDVENLNLDNPSGSIKR